MSQLCKRIKTVPTAQRQALDRTALCGDLGWHVRSCPDGALPPKEGAPDGRQILGVGDLQAVVQLLGADDGARRVLHLHPAGTAAVSTTRCSITTPNAGKLMLTAAVRSCL